jgi:hypothetical protein
MMCIATAIVEPRWYSLHSNDRGMVMNMRGRAVEMEKTDLHGRRIKDRGERTNKTERRSDACSLLPRPRSAPIKARKRIASLSLIPSNPWQSTA